MRRRDFIKGISVWTAWPLAAHVQLRKQKRRVAVLMGGRNLRYMPSPALYVTERDRHERGCQGRGRFIGHSTWMSGYLPIVVSPECSRATPLGRPI
jgi:hypothetical protein